MKKLTVLLLSALLVQPAYSIGVCKGGNRAANKATCIYDGDTGWEDGVKWRTLGVDTPEINSNAACARENQLGLDARDRLIQLMNGGYSIRWSNNKGGMGRELVDIYLADGRDASKVLKQEGLAQNWPNTGNIWCQ